MINMKPADELLTVRQKIKELQAREAELKSGLIARDLDPCGDFALVSISSRKTKRFDRKAAEDELGDLSRFDVTGETTVLKVEALEAAE